MRTEHSPQTAQARSQGGSLLVLAGAAPSLGRDDRTWEKSLFLKKWHLAFVICCRCAISVALVEGGWLQLCLTSPAGSQANFPAMQPHADARRGCNSHARLKLGQPGGVL